MTRDHSSRRSLPPGDRAVVSLRGFLAHRRLQRYRALPASLRTAPCTAPVADAIVAYAWEPVAVGRPRARREVCRRLGEFLPPAGRWDLMRWLSDNQVPEAWQSPAGLRRLVAYCLRTEDLPRRLSLS